MKLIFGPRPWDWSLLRPGHGLSRYCSTSEHGPPPIPGGITIKIINILIAQHSLFSCTLLIVVTLFLASILNPVVLSCFTLFSRKRHYTHRNCYLLSKRDNMHGSALTFCYALLYAIYEFLFTFSGAHSGDITHYCSGMYSVHRWFGWMASSSLNSW